MKSRSLRWSNIIFIGLALLLICGVAFFLPLKLHERKLVTEERAAERKITLQDLIQSGGLWGEDLKQSEIDFLFPFDTISLDRSPCFGPCPVYAVTFYKDGSAQLTKNNWDKNQVETYSGTIGPVAFARLTQLTIAAKKSALKDRYAGQWTDAYTATIRAKSKDLDWSVSDYGQTSPIEVWALAEILHSYQEQVNWTLTSKVPMKGPTTQSR